MFLRQARLKDLDAILPMGEHMVKTSTYKNYTFSHEKTRALFEAVITHGFFMVAEDNGKVVGGMAGDVVSPFFSEDKMGIEFAIFLKPEYRNGFIAPQLVGHWLEWCKEQGAIEARPGITTGDKSATTLYQALGFETVGAMFVMNLGD
jgi:L-amino acid N-acyltransferase YncA